MPAVTVTVTRLRTAATKRTEWWNVQKDRSNPAKGKHMVRKAAVRNPNGTFVGATNYRVGKSIKGSKIEA